MNKLVFAVSATGAFAADLPVKAPVASRDTDLPIF